MIFKKVLIICTQYPYYGGASTNTYQIIKLLRKSGYETYGIFIENNNQVDIDPENIGNIFRVPYYLFSNKIDPKIIDKYKQMLLKAFDGKPDLIITKNYFAPICAKIFFPDVKNLYLVPGIHSIINNDIVYPASELLKSNIDMCLDSEEIDAFNNSDLILFNSNLSRDLYRHLFSKKYYFENKIIPDVVDTAIYSTLDIIPKTRDKIYDILVVSSIISRKEKNNCFAASILNHKTFDQHTKIVIGNNNNMFDNVPKTIRYNLLPRKELHKIMSKSKILLYPSLYDSNPSTIREAIMNNCIPLISNNIGYYNCYPAFLVCDTYDILEWVSKINYLIDNYDNIDLSSINFVPHNCLLNIVQNI